MFCCEGDKAAQDDVQQVQMTSVVEEHAPSLTMPHADEGAVDNNVNVFLVQQEPPQEEVQHEPEQQGPQQSEGTRYDGEDDRRPSKKRQSLIESFEELRPEPTPREKWSRPRKAAAWILEAPFPGSDSNMFDSFMGFVILFNIVIMIVETDQSVGCADCIAPWIITTNYVLLGLYTVESALRLFVLRAGFFFSGWCLLDLTIVLTGLAGIALQDAGDDLRQVNMLRMFRIARVIRVAKILKRIPTLHNMIRGFTGAMQAMFWGLCLILVLLMIWSILAVELLHPTAKKLFPQEGDWCGEAFSTVLRSTLLFFQTLVAGDSWGACAISIVHESPLTFFVFAFALVSVQLGFTNLVLAIIVDKAAEAREGSKEEQAALRKLEEEESFSDWRKVMKDMDQDGSGTISEEELLSGYDCPTVKKTLDSMDISKDDLIEIYRLLDDGSQNLHYQQLLDVFFKAEKQDPRIYLMGMKLQIQRLETRFDDVLQAIRALKPSGGLRSFLPEASFGAACADVAGSRPSRADVAEAAWRQLLSGRAAAGAAWREGPAAGGACWRLGCQSPCVVMVLRLRPRGCRTWVLILAAGEGRCAEASRQPRTPLSSPLTGWLL